MIRAQGRNRPATRGTGGVLLPPACAQRGGGPETLEIGEDPLGIAWGSRQAGTPGVSHGSQD